MLWVTRRVTGLVERSEVHAKMMDMLPTSRDGSTPHLSVNLTGPPQDEKARLRINRPASGQRGPAQDRRGMSPLRKNFCASEGMYNAAD